MLRIYNPDLDSPGAYIELTQTTRSSLTEFVESRANLLRTLSDLDPDHLLEDPWNNTGVILRFDQGWNGEATASLRQLVAAHNFWNPDPELSIDQVLGRIANDPEFEDALLDNPELADALDSYDFVKFAEMVGSARLVGEIPFIRATDAETRCHQWLEYVGEILDLVRAAKTPNDEAAPNTDHQSRILTELARILPRDELRLVSKRAMGYSRQFELRLSLALGGLFAPTIEEMSQAHPDLERFRLSARTDWLSFKYRVLYEAVVGLELLCIHEDYVHEAESRQLSSDLNKCFRAIKNILQGVVRESESGLADQVLHPKDFPPQTDSGPVEPDMAQGDMPTTNDAAPGEGSSNSVPTASDDMAPPEAVTTQPGSTAGQSIVINVVNTNVAEATSFASARAESSPHQIPSPEDPSAPVDPSTAGNRSGDVPGEDASEDRRPAQDQSTAAGETATDPASPTSGQESETPVSKQSNEDVEESPNSGVQESRGVPNSVNRESERQATTLQEGECESKSTDQPSNMAQPDAESTTVTPSSIPSAEQVASSDQDKRASVKGSIATQSESPAIKRIEIFAADNDDCRLKVDGEAKFQSVTDLGSRALLAMYLLTNGDAEQEVESGKLIDLLYRDPRPTGDKVKRVTRALKKQGVYLRTANDGHRRLRNSRFEQWKYDKSAGDKTHDPDRESIEFFLDKHRSDK